MPKRIAPPSPTRPALVLFTAPERDLIRREFHPRFGQDPSVADGIMLRTWRGGPNAGQPKLPPAVQSLLARGLVEAGIAPGDRVALLLPNGADFVAAIVAIARAGAIAVPLNVRLRPPHSLVDVNLPCEPSWLQISSVSVWGEQN